MSTLFPITAQLDVQVSKPPLTGMQVPTLNDLTTEGARRPYQHKVVWVISERAYYYLATGNGQSLNQWSPISTSGIMEWEARPYERGVGVILNNKVFISTASTNANEDPINTPAKWLPISEVRFSRQDFVEAELVTIVSGYTHPIVQVFNTKNEIVSAMVMIQNGTITIDLYPKMSGYVIVKE